MTPQSIHALCQRGDVAALLALFQSDPSINLSERDSQDVTPLQWASINAHVGTCRWLLDNGADVDAIGGELKATPLQWAARNGHLYVVHLLLSRGADPNISDAQGFNTLHLITHSSAVMPLLYMVCTSCRKIRLRPSCINPSQSTRRIPMATPP
jgi:ankyrin repeat protein